ncbi:Expansin-A13 [Bienertia sinuspersici]
MFGECGFGNLDKAWYGNATARLSSSLFNKGQIFGACFELRCVQDLRNCIPTTSILITATNFCPPYYAFSAHAGESCNLPNKHFALPIKAFEKIAL